MSGDIANFSVDKYDWDWRTQAVSMTMAGYQVLKIPVGTIVYCGVEALLPDGEFGRHQYFATLDTALYYAFSHGEKNKGEFGKVITAEVIADVYLLDMTKTDNYPRLRQDFPEKFTGKDDLLDDIFSDGLARESYHDEDTEFSTFLCQNLKLDGWALTQMRWGWRSATWHDEIMICQPIKHLRRLEYEFRALKITDKTGKPWMTPNFGSACDILLTKNGLIVKKFTEIARHRYLSSNSYENELSKGKLFSRVNCVSGWLGDKGKVSDQYLIEILGSKFGQWEQI